LRHVFYQPVERAADIKPVVYNEITERKGRNIMDFERFKNSIRHEVKRLGDESFVKKIVESEEIKEHYQKEEYLECFYLLAMIDYLSRLNNLPFQNEYNYIRKYRMSETIYPSDVIALSLVFKSDEPMEESLLESIPEFLKYNIVESDIRDVA
jgi:hypothetical protein